MSILSHTSCLSQSTFHFFNFSFFPLCYLWFLFLFNFFCVPLPVSPFFFQHYRDYILKHMNTKLMKGCKDYAKHNDHWCNVFTILLNCIIFISDIYTVIGLHPYSSYNNNVFWLNLTVKINIIQKHSNELWISFVEFRCSD